VLSRQLSGSAGVLGDCFPIDLVLSKMHGMYYNIFPSSINEKGRAHAVQGQKTLEPPVSLKDTLFQPPFSFGTWDD
jgi:hypothetical protein